MPGVPQAAPIDGIVGTARHRLTPRFQQITAYRPMPRLLVLGAVLIAGWVVTAQAANACDPSAEQDVRAVAEGIIAADNARDIERVLGYYAADAILMPPGEQPVTGREAIRPRYEGLFAEFNPAIEAHIEEICAGNDLAIVRGHNGGRLVPRAGGAARTLNDVYLMVLHRNAEGEWRISRLMWHAADPQ